MSVATTWVMPMNGGADERLGAGPAMPRRHLAAVPEQAAGYDMVGIWMDAEFATEADEIVSALNGLALLEAEVLSI